MNDLLQPGHHPDADLLSAFAEHALPAHEHQQTLAHLAICPDCRALVYLAQETETEQPHPAGPSSPWFASWFSGWNLALPVAALAGLALLTIHLRGPHSFRTQSGPTTTASIQPAPPDLPAIAKGLAAAHASPISVSPRSTPSPAQKKPHVIPTPQLQRGNAGAVATAADGPPFTAAQPAATRTLSVQRQLAGESAIAGVITDAAGATIPHAQITATNTETGAQITRESTATGGFSLSPLLPGNYNVEVAARGFQRLLQENVQVAPFQVAGLNPKLTVGGENTTVTVTNAPPLLETANATIGGTIGNELYTNLPLSMNAGPRAATQNAGPRDPTQFQYLMPGVQEGPPPTSAGGQTQGIYGGSGQQNLNENYIEGIPVSNISGQGGNSPVAKPIAAASAGAFSMAANPTSPAQPTRSPALPSKLLAVSIVTDASRTLAIDTEGALFRSDDAGVTWHPVPAQWQGRALTLRLAQTPSVARQAAAKNTVTTAEARQPAQTLAPQAPAFELTTDSGAIYTSPDGQTWQRK
jgi:hypothetical protein